MKKRIVFITDCSDSAYSELRGVTLKSLQSIDDVDIEPVVSVQPFSIINGSFLLRLMGDAYPPGTIFSVILNPMRKRPARILGKTKENSFLFMGANTGVFDWFLKDFGIEELYELHDPGFLPFGGKYVHAPNIAKIATGVNLQDLGIPFNPKKLIKFNVETGTIVHIDNFGLIKFMGSLTDTKEGDTFKVRVNDKEITAKCARRMMNEETGQWVLYPGSSLGLPELGKVRSNGAQELNLHIGDIISFNKM